jgi:hypothetical protein
VWLGLVMPRVTLGLYRECCGAQASGSCLEVERRSTFDRAVWTKPLAFAADAAPQLCPFNRTDPCARACLGASMVQVSG